MKFELTTLITPYLFIGTVQLTDKASEIKRPYTKDGFNFIKFHITYNENIKDNKIYSFIFLYK